MSLSRDSDTVIRMASPPCIMCSRKFSLGNSARATGIAAASTRMSSPKKSGRTANRQGACTRSFSTPGPAVVLMNDMPAVELVGDLTRLATRRAEPDLQRHGRPAILLDGQRRPLQVRAIVANRLQASTELQLVAQPRVQGHLGRVLVEHSHDLVVHHHGTALEAMRSIVFLHGGPAALIGQFFAREPGCRRRGGVVEVRQWLGGGFRA